MDIYFRIRSGEQIDPYEIRIRKNDGEYLLAELTPALLKEDGKPIGTIGIARDVTERKKAQRELIQSKERAEQSEKLKDAFITNMSHEIRTPLNIIMGFTSIIEDRMKRHCTDEDARYFENIRSGTMRLVRTIDHILNISRLQIGEFPLRPAILETSKLIQSIVNEFEFEARAKSLTLSFVNECKNCSIEADEYCISQAVSNLIDNAIKYTKAGSIMALLSEGSQGDMLLTIRDTGIGISDEYLQHMYEPYSQEKSGYSRPYEGLGLGLSLVLNYLELNHVGIQVQSKKGVGTLFTLTFPKSIRRPSSVEPKKAPVRLDRAGLTAMHAEFPRLKHILVVEDDLMTQRYMEHILTNSFDVHTVDSAEEAWNVLHKHPIDLIFMDLSIVGNKNGLELTTEIRSTNGFRDIPIVALTAHAFEQDRARCLAAGCNDYIRKPMEIDTLYETMKRIFPTDGFPRKRE